MGFLVLLILLGAPVAEIWLMIEVGGEIGALPTVALILATAAIGTLLFRIQGMATLARVRSHMDRGEMPVGELLSGLGLLVAGFLLLVPGFVTDILGFLLFIPPVRRAAIAALLAWIIARGGGTGIWVSKGGPANGRTIIDGDYTDVTGTDDPQRRGPDSDPERLDHRRE